MLKKRQAAGGDASTSGAAAGAAGGGESDAAGAAAQAVEFDVIGVVRRKLHFKSRPKALISKFEPAAAAVPGGRKRATGAGVDAGFFTKRSKPAAPVTAAAQ